MKDFVNKNEKNRAGLTQNNISNANKEKLIQK